MLNVIKSVGTGIICGFIFGFAKLPIPAPTVFAGIAGIIGIWLGFVLATKLWG